MSFYLYNECARVCQQVAGNPRPERFTTETAPEREWRLKFSDSKEGEEDSKKPRSTETTSPY